MKKFFERILSDLKNNYPAILVIAGYLILTEILFHEACPSKILFHTSCPGCGLTHGCLAILRLDFLGALRYNPASYLWFGLILACLIQRYVLGKNFAWGNRLALGLVCFLTILSFWVNLYFFA